MMHNQAKKIAELTTLVDQLKHRVSAQFLAEYVPMAKAYQLGINPTNPFMGCCIYLNHLMCQELKAHGFDATFVGGMASFSVNAGQWGMLEYGRLDPSMRNADGSTFNGEAFVGHCWVKIESLDVIVDATLMHLKSQVETDSEYNGICMDSTEDQFLLDPEKLVLSPADLNTRDALFSGDLGYAYTENAYTTAHATQLLSETIAMVRSVIHHPHLTLIAV